MLTMRSLFQVPSLILGIMMLISTGSEAVPLSNSGDRNSQLKQSRDGFLNSGRPNQESMSQMINVSELQNTTPTQFLPRPDRNSQLKQSRDGVLNPTRQNRGSMSQVTNVSELQDIAPTEWAYEALRGLVERYGCVVGYPDRTFRGNRALSRHEFAAGLNACLNTIERLLQENVAVLREDIDKLKRLAKEFEGELMALGARVGNLEERTAYLEDHQFSTTTILTGEIVVGLTGITNGEKNEGTEDIPRVNNLGYRGRLELNTSFDGDDSLYVRLATGTVPSYSAIAGTFEGDFGFSQPDDSDLAVELIIYEFALAENLRMFVEPVGGAFDDFTPTINFLDGDGAAGALSAFGTRNPLYYMAEGPGIGFKGTLFEVFQWSAGYLATDGNSPDLGEGMFNGPYGAIGQISYQPSDSFEVAFTYVHGYNNLDTGTGSRRSNFQTFIEEDFETDVNTVNNSYGMEFSWRIAPKFIFGGWAGFTTSRTQNAINIVRQLTIDEMPTQDLPRGDIPMEEMPTEEIFTETMPTEELFTIEKGNIDVWNWAVTLGFPDAFVEGDTAAIIIGMQPWVSKSTLALPDGLRNNDRDSSYHIEAFYQYPINDNISITPGIIVITSPDYDDKNDALVIGTIRTTFSF
ncbi:iron uptake porin [Crocosphaera sp. UHCC 0190]|uniref:iron uptake porin n=1 Tax=Crocosphaera sp. UHCC 0190 TaxID=3110246 RepID=UPI002B20B039|nr:iron uptake porin [Crocosphaera sp. UHCC 0190]MEA5511007.1 iron uptake porin [Crocosphaera sp. UHCC 0190]